MIRDRVLALLRQVADGTVTVDAALGRLARDPVETLPFATIDHHRALRQGYPEVILAQAYRDAQKIKGDGDAKATATYSAAYQGNPEFYAFYRSLEAYKSSFKSRNDVLVLDPGSEFFKYLRSGGKAGK